MIIKKLSRLFHFIVLAFLVGVVIHNQKALSSMNRTVEELSGELRRSVVLSEEEFPIRGVLDEKGGNKLTELERVKIAMRIQSLDALGVDSRFTLDLIRRESTFNAGAVSSKGAMGLMQLMPSTARWLALKAGVPWKGDEILFDPVKNVELGTAYLAYLSQDFRGDKLLRAAYQSGPNWVRKNMKGELYARDP